jgi:D-inositol-3-phosphate glycosyltransferase
MRIALITDGGAVGRDTADLAAALTRLGHEPVVHENHRGSAASFVDRWRATSPEVVHCRSQVAGPAAVDAAGLLGIPVVYSVRVVEDAQMGPAERDIALRADRVITSCEAERAELVAGRVGRNRISVVPYGVDVELFSPDGDRPSAGHTHRLVAVGDLTPGAGFATAIAALTGLPDTELVIAGSPSQGKHAKELQAYARRHQVSKRVLMPGPVSRSELPALLRSATIVLVTPWRPRFGTIAVEAAASGVPVVASNTGGLVDTVVDGFTGLLVPPHRPRALAAAVWKLLSQPVLLEQYGAVAHDRACVRYSWDQIAVDTLTAYRHADAEPKSSARRSQVRERRPTSGR